MPWLPASPGHQQPWYWLCRIGRSLSCSRRNFYLCLINVEELQKMQIYVYVLSEKIARKWLTISMHQQQKEVINMCRLINKLICMNCHKKKQSSKCIRWEYYENFVGQMSIFCDRYIALSLITRLFSFECMALLLTMGRRIYHMKYAVGFVLFWQCYQLFWHWNIYSYASRLLRWYLDQCNKNCHSINSYPSEQNACHFSRRHFQMHFLERKW